MVEQSGLHKDGRVIPLEISFAEFMNGGRRCFTGIIRDITERKRAQEILEESEERYREVVESQTDLVCRYRADTTLTFVNEAYCRCFQKRREELIGSKFLELLPRTAWDRVLKDIASLNKEHRTQTHEHEVILPDGSIGWQQWINHPIVEPDGSVVEYQAVGRDIIDRKRAEEAMRHLAHVTRVSTLGALAGSLAHELNQPLTAILSNAQAGSRFLTEPAPNVAEVREVLQDIAHETKRAGEVIRQMRNLVKKGDLQFEAIDLNQVIHDVVRLLHSDMVIRKVQLVLDFQPELPPVHGDAIQLQQVLLNLLLNASDSMKDVRESERTVRVSTRHPDPSTVQIEVSDRGTGIHPKRLTGIFEPFQTTKPDGLGLGLSISRSIVEAHGGRLWVENNADRGATFSFTIPIISVPAN
jgi:PAS domain S-box-containing protein